jgi:epoxyqueuosine reductase QueG
MDIQNDLAQLANELKIDYFGVADLETARSFVDQMSDGLLAKYPFALSIGIALPHRIVDDLEKIGSDFTKISYHTHAYSLVNERLNHVASVFHSLLQKGGYPSYPIAASQRFSDTGISSLFSHKLAAHLSGLGWIGKSCLLVTENDGPRTRWISVLTDAPLEPTGDSVTEPKCGNCRKCVDVCPANAFKNRRFDPDEPRYMRYDAAKCQAHFDSLKRKSRIHVCGLCLAACPFGKNREK